MDDAEQELKAIQKKWTKPGTQGAGIYVRQDDALNMIDILEKHQIPLDGFETFRMFPDGGVQPDITLSMDYWPGDGVKETVYAHAREHIKKLMDTGEAFYYEISYDSARRLKEDVRAGRIKRPDNWSPDWDE